MKNLLTALVAASFAVIIYGCKSTDGNLLEIARMQEQQAAEIEKISKAVKQNSQAIEKLQTPPANAAENAQGNDLVQAALLLLRNGPQNAKSQAITILGYLGGEKAEDALLKTLEDGSVDRNYSSQVINALNMMGSRKVRDVVLKLLKSSNYQDKEIAINALQNYALNVLKKSDLPLIANVLQEIPNNENNRYRRINIIRAICRLDQELGAKLICDELETTNPNQQSELLYIPVHNNINLGFKAWRKIIDIMGEPDSMNANAFYALCDAIGRNPDFRFTDLVLPWAAFAEQNSNFKNTYLNLLNNLKDPKAAKEFLELTIDNKNYYGYLSNYPGIVKTSGEYQLADEATMKKLLERREKIIKGLNERDAKRDARDKAEKEAEKKL